MKKCIDCGGKMFKEKFNYKSNWGSNEVDVPAEIFVCEKCGSPVFEYKEAVRIQKLAIEASEGNGE